MTVGVVIQARLGSQRYPRKVFQNLANKPVLLHVIERCKEAGVGEVIVATPDEEVAAFARSSGVKASIGSEQNVLWRVLDAAIEHRLSRAIRVCADCPLVEPEAIVTLAGYGEFAGYVGFRHVEDGMPAIQTKVGLPELVSVQALGLLLKHMLAIQEHVTFGCYSSPGIPAKWLDIRGRRDEQNAIDTPEDLQRIQEWMNSRFQVAG